MTFDEDFSKNSWEAIKEACRLGIAHKLWDSGKKEKLLKDTVTGETFKLTVYIDPNNLISTEIEAVKPEVNIRTPFINGKGYK